MNRYKNQFPVVTVLLVMTACGVQQAPVGKVESDKTTDVTAVAPAAKPSPRNEMKTTAPVSPLTIRDGDFIDASGQAVRFWGVNLCSLYPTHAQSEGLAAQLADRQVNLVRPHHLLRPSGDWSTGPAALVTYDKNSRTFSKEALDRFDFLNAELRKKGIYLAMSSHFSRDILPGDFDILATTAEDQAAWREAVAEINAWDWKKSIDIKKMLPTIDERSALISEEFTVALLNHVNPYTGKSYAEDPQVLTWEVLNESSAEYAIVCNNRFPKYFEDQLQARWGAYCRDHGVEPGDIYKPADNKARNLRADFLRKLDEDYFLRIKAAVAKTGSKVPVTFSNLWRGDNVADMHYQHADWVENHIYTDPMVVKGLDDGIRQVGRNVLVDKPFFIGELNQAEGGDNIQKQKPFRTMLPLAMVSYGLLHGWDGLVWFAWTHGDRPMGPDGKSTKLDRESHLGEMMSDAMMQDHLRTAGYVFRNALVAPSTHPVTIWIDKPFTAGDYNGLMRGKNGHKEGWQNIHAFSKAYGPVPEGQSTAPWMSTLPENPLVSDTGEIIKDIERRQLTVSAPRTEMLSGYLDGAHPLGLKHLAVEGSGNFVSLILVSLDGEPLATSRHLLMSRTMLDADSREVGDPPVTLTGLTSPREGRSWHMTVTRTTEGEPGPQSVHLNERGVLSLPAINWNECELRLK